MADANKLTLFIVVFMLAGILPGTVTHSYTSPDVVAAWANSITLLIDIFLRLIKMVIALLVFSTLTVGTMRLGETSTIGCVGGKVVLWFISSSILSILVGLLMVSLERSDSGPDLAIPLGATDTDLAVGGMSLEGFLAHTIPTNIAEAMANNKILQIMVFSMFFDIGSTPSGEKLNAPLVAALDVAPHIMFKVTGYVMYVVLLAIFTAISFVTSTQGLGILPNYTSFIGGYYVAILLTYLALLTVGYVVLKKEVFRLVSMPRDPVPVALTTSGSEAVYPRTLKQLTKLGCSLNIVSSMLSIGYSFNLVGPTVYCSFASMSIMQACNIHLSFAEITVLMLTPMLVSKGVVGVPRSTLVVLTTVVPNSNILVVGIPLLMGIDHSLNMGRSATSVSGDGVVTAMLAQDEGLPEGEQELVEREA